MDSAPIIGRLRRDGPRGFGARADLDCTYYFRGSNCVENASAGTVSR